MVAKARVAADLLPISEKEVRDLSFPSPTAAPRRATTLLRLPLLLYLPSPTVLPFFLSLPRQRGFSSALVTVFKSGDPVLRFRVSIVLPESYNPDWKLSMHRKIFEQESFGVTEI